MDIPLVVFGTKKQQQEQQLNFCFVFKALFSKSDGRYSSENEG